ncbi:flagellar basal body-associated FliL family protein [Demequina capsici]|uniref:Flagellar protein FliL n=1 Tax=Demequina capsici TaxID=3075620 RepID=A0AA96FCQ5_9MICO|nr:MULTISPECIES: flagellar basal body-associated FliL family protein [unclassified Demequina]WNM24562.1 flagellar basal body-associated FliL family protein [Demequina sp. OYTSA14]WNM27413.1 flagellar basal body-associated FliL family protein [Demequina sp. PMTSA13]
MTTQEARIMAPGKPKIGARPTPTPAPEEPKDDGKGGGRKRLLSMIVGLVVLVAAGAAYWFLAGPGAASSTADGAAAEATPAPELGAIQTVDAISVNLDSGHYLRLGLGLQLTADVKEDVDTAKALDAAIALFSGRTQDELSDDTVREQLKQELGAELTDLYDGEVVGVYYTDFVTQ